MLAVAERHPGSATRRKPGGRIHGEQAVRRVVGTESVTAVHRADPPLKGSYLTSNTAPGVAFGGALE